MRPVPFVLTLAALLALAGCGIDGAPERPIPGEEGGPGLTISGDAQLGISGSTKGR